MATTELRCDNRILLGMLGDGFIELKCRSNRCGARRGVVIIHRFSVVSGDLLETLRFKDPASTGKAGEQDGPTGDIVALRPA